jgi:plastocyanin
VSRSCALVAVVGLLAVLAAGCAGGSTGEAGRPANEVPVGGSPPPEGGAGKTVVIDNFTFNPPTLTVAVGTKVTWVNRDDVPHTVTSTTKPRTLESGTLDTEDKYSFVFAAPGTFAYFCAVHPKMTGQIVVK